MAYNNKSKLGEIPHTKLQIIIKKKEEKSHVGPTSLQNGSNDIVSPSWFLVNFNFSGSGIPGFFIFFFNCVGVSPGTWMCTLS